MERLLELARDVEAWGFAGEKPLRTNAAPHHPALVLPWLFQRLPDQIVSELRAELDAGPEPDPGATSGPTAYFELLKRLARPEAPPRLSLRELDDELLREPNLARSPRASRSKASCSRRRASRGASALRPSLALSRSPVTTRRASCSSSAR